MTEETKSSKPRTTRDVLDRLQRLGLSVTSTMIADDTAAYYLPERETAHMGRDGATGVWEPWMERRAERLYRLRTLNRRTRRGPSGNVLRTFLFLRDSWGWEHIKKTCIEGYRILIRGNMRGVPNRVRGRPLTLESLLDSAYEIAEDQYRPQDPNQAQIDRVKMTIGLLKLGSAPDSKMGTIELFMDTFTPPGADPNEIRKWKALAPLGWTMLGASESEAGDILESELSDAVIKRSVRQLGEAIWTVRSGFRRRFPGREKGKRFHTNPLTFFRFAAHLRFSEVFRRMPIRCTPAQVLGGHIAYMLVISYREEELRELADSVDKWLVWWLQSDACRQWITQMERELNQQKS